MKNEPIDVTELTSGTIRMRWRKRMAWVLLLAICGAVFLLIAGIFGLGAACIICGSMVATAWAVIWAIEQLWPGPRA